MEEAGTTEMGSSADEDDRTIIVMQRGIG